MRHRTLVSGALVSLSFFISCKDATAPGGLRISTAMEAIAIENTNDESIYTFVMDESHMALVDWVPCVQDDCGRILAGETRTLTYDQLQTGPGQRVRIYYWKAVLGPADEATPGPVGMRIIRLPTGQLLR
jgi:hypothetical protein